MNGGWDSDLFLIYVVNLDLDYTTSDGRSGYHVSD